MARRSHRPDPDGDPEPLNFDPDRALASLDALRHLREARRRGNTQPTTHEALCPRCGVSMAYHGRLDVDGHRSSVCPAQRSGVL